VAYDPEGEFITYYHIFPVQHRECPHLTFDAYIETDTEETFTGFIRVRCMACGEPFQADISSTKCTTNRPDHLPTAVIV
jgi:hypothetical protein